MCTVHFLHNTAQVTPAVVGFSCEPHLAWLYKLQDTIAPFSICKNVQGLAKWLQFRREIGMQTTLKNRSIFCRDNLEVLRGIDSESVDLIYLDPPFNKKKTFHAPIGSTAAGASFKDIWEMADTKDEWHGQLAEAHPQLYQFLDGVSALGDKSNKYYLIYLAVRLAEMKRILKATGSLYLHCDPTMSHFLKLLLDTIFGADNFRNEIVWGYRTGGVSKHYFPRKHDILLCYGKIPKGTCHHPPQERIFLDKPFFSSKQDEKGRFYADVYLRDVWDDSEVKPLINLSKERVGYPTQKPVALLERIIKASSNAGDVVLDPFCGCATTCVAAEGLGRQWVGIDISERAFALQRLKTTVERAGEPWPQKVYYREDIPERTDTVKSPLKKAEIKHVLYGQQEGKCKGCNTLFAYRHFHVDHIVPKAKGGADGKENLQLLCGSCNMIKGDKDMAYLGVGLKEIG